MTPTLVLDNSIVMAWCLQDEMSMLADAAMEAAAREGAWVPAIWWHEVRNALLMSETYGRATPADTGATLEDLSALTLVVDSTGTSDDVLAAARSFGLSFYDAEYLELALRRQLTLATLDQRLVDAATDAGVPLFSLVDPADSGISDV